MTTSERDVPGQLQHLLHFQFLWHHKQRQSPVGFKMSKKIIKVKFSKNNQKNIEWSKLSYVNSSLLFDLGSSSKTSKGDKGKYIFLGIKISVIPQPRCISHAASWVWHVSCSNAPVSCTDHLWFLILHHLRCQYRHEFLVLHKLSILEDSGISK